MNTGLNGNSNYLRDVMGLAGAMHPLIAGAQKKLEQASRRSFDNPSIANARWAQAASPHCVTACCWPVSAPAGLPRLASLEQRLSAAPQPHCLSIPAPALPLLPICAACHTHYPDP